MCTNQIKGYVSVVTIDSINAGNVCVIIEWQLEVLICQEDKVKVLQKLKLLCFYIHNTCFILIFYVLYIMIRDMY